MHLLSRRELIAAAGAALFLDACGGSSPGGSGQLSVIRVGSPTLDFAPLILAQRSGLFAAQRVRVGTLNAEVAGEAIQQVIAGNATIARANAFVLATAVANEHAPLVAIATDFQMSTGYVVSLGQHPIRSLRDLVGKTIGVQTLQGGVAQVLSVQLQRERIPQSSVKRIAVGESSAAFGFLQDHRADAIIATGDKLEIMAKSDPSLVWFNLTGLGPVFGESYVVTHQTLHSRRAELIAFLRAVRQAMLELIDPSTQPTAFRRLSGTGFTVLANPVTARKAMGVLTAAWLAAGRSNLLRNVPALWDQDVRALVAAGMLHPDASAAEMYTNTLIDAAGA